MASQAASQRRAKGTYTEHKMSFQALSSTLSTSLDEANPEASRGLTKDQASRRLAEQGRNELTPPKQMSLAERILRVLFTDAFMLMLEGAAILGFIAYSLTPDDPSNLYMSGALLVIVALTSALTLFQEGQASDVMAGFKNMLPAQAFAIRDGQQIRISAATLVTGDIVVIGTGDKIPADLRIISVNALRVDNSSLTGESLPIKCTVQPESDEFLEAHNLIFSGTLAVEGTGLGVVIRTGDRSMVGSIAALASETSQEKSTLEIEIIRFLQTIGTVAVIMAIILFGISLLRFGTSTKAIVQAFVTSFIVVILSNLPQGLPSAVAMSLTIAAKRLALNKVFVKSLNSVETLGSVSVIASDKTGTLTQNCMTVTSIWMNKKVHLVQTLMSVERDDDFDMSNPLSDTLATLSLIAGSCNMAKPLQKTNDVVVRTDSIAARTELSAKKRISSVYLTGRDAPGSRMSRASLAPPPVLPVTADQLTGNASDIALYVFADKFGTAPVVTSRERWRQVFQVPFSSARKWMASVLAPPASASDQRRILCVKGAPERILQRCTRILVNGREDPLDDSARQSFQKANDKYMAQGRRVLALSMRVLSLDDFPANMPLTAEKERFQKLFDDGGLVLDKPSGVQEGLTMVGCAALEDPPKETVPGAIMRCRKAGIKVVMVTGDHPATAAAIARQCNILGMYNTKDDLSRQRSKTMGKSVRVDDDDEDVGGIVVTGKELQTFTDNDWDRVLSKPEIVFARTSPHDKLQIVEQLQKRGEVVAVTGDGVNDSPALKKADVGVAMGISGSDVAKDAGDIVLIDDEFNSLVVGIEQGRIIFDNLTKLVTFTITHLTAEIVAILVSLGLGMPQGMTSLCILSLDLLTDVAPALALAYEKAEDHVMDRPPRDTKKDRLVSLKVMFYAYFQAGVLEVIPGVFAYLMTFRAHNLQLSELFNQTTYFVLGAPTYTSRAGERLNEGQQLSIVANAQTAFWCTIVLSQCFHAFMCKTRVASVFKQGLFNNQVLNACGLAMLGIMVAVVYIPFLQPVFGTASHDNFWFWVPCFISWALLLVWNEGRKWGFRNYPESTFTKILAW